MHGSHFWENNLLRKRTDDQSALPVSLGKLVTDQSKSFCRLPSFFPTILSPNFSFFVAFRCIKTSSCKTNCEDIVKMDSGKFGKLSVGLIVNLCFDPECKSFLEYALASQFPNPIGGWMQAGNICGMVSRCNHWKATQEDIMSLWIHKNLENF